MTVLAAALAVLGLLFCGNTEAAAFAGEPDGFGGLVWGEPKAGLESLKYKGTDSGGILLYERTGDELLFGRAKLAAVEYGFEGGRLTSVILRVDSLLQYLLLKEEAFRRYGEGRKETGGEDVYAWIGDNTEISLVSQFVVS